MEDRQYHEAMRRDEEMKLASIAKERHTAGMGANSTMIGGNHYKVSSATGTCPSCRGPVEHWDWAANLRGLEYAATKYLARWRDKGGLDSLKKVIHYTQKLIEIHFPGVVVRVSYENSAQSAEGGRAESGQKESIPRFMDPRNTGEEAPRSFAVDGSEFKDSTVCTARDIKGQQCHLMRHHLGPHETMWAGS